MERGDGERIPRREEKEEEEEDEEKQWKQKQKNKNKNKKKEKETKKEATNKKKKKKEPVSLISAHQIRTTEPRALGTGAERANRSTDRFTLLRTSFGAGSDPCSCPAV